MRKRKLRKKIFHIFATFSISILLFLFFFQGNIWVQQRNLLGDYTRKVNELSGANENLEMGFIEKNHLGNIAKIAKELNFEKAEKIHYIKVLEGTVVSR